MGKTAKSIVNHVDPKPRRNCGILPNIVYINLDLDKRNTVERVIEEDSNVGIEEREISSDTNNSHKRPKKKRKNGSNLCKEIPTRRKRKRMASRVVRENTRFLKEKKKRPKGVQLDNVVTGRNEIIPDDGLDDLDEIIPDDGLDDLDEIIPDKGHDDSDVNGKDIGRYWDTPSVSVCQLQNTSSKEPSCDHYCFKLPPEIFKKNLTYFRSLLKSEQDAHLASLMQNKPVKMSEFRKSLPIVYMLKHEIIGIVVCRRAFLHAFRITEERLRDIWQNRVTKREEQFLVMRKTLMKIPTLVPLSKTAKQSLYFAPDLNLDKLYALYCQFIAQEGLGEPVTIDSYRMVFKRCSNVRLVQKKNGRCHVCERLDSNIQKFSVLPDKEIPLMEAMADLKKHEALAMEDQKVIVFVQKRPDVKNSLILCIGKQQSYPIPGIPTDLNYYKRKLWAHYLGIRDLKRHVATKVYVWDEATAKRGSIEAISCLSKWIEDNHDQEDNLVLFTDGIGRYRNLNMLLFLLQLIHSKKFLKIEHYFLVQGHHTNPCNLIYSDIDSALEFKNFVASKEDLVGHIRDTVSKRDGDVVVMERKDFLDYSVMQPHVCESTLDGITFRNARVVTLHCRYKEGYYATGDYSKVNMSSEVRLMPGLKPFKLKAFNLRAVEIPLKYPHPIPLDPRKVSDLKDLLHCIVPYEKRDYLRMVLADQESLKDETVVKGPFEEEGEEEDGLFDYV